MAGRRPLGSVDFLTEIERLTGPAVEAGQLVQPGVDAPPAEEVRMPPDLPDASPMEHHDPVGVVEGGEPVGDDEARPTLHEAV